MHASAPVFRAAQYAFDAEMLSRPRRSEQHGFIGHRDVHRIRSPRINRNRAQAHRFRVRITRQAISPRWRSAACEIAVRFGAIHSHI